MMKKFSIIIAAIIVFIILIVGANVGNKSYFLDNFKKYFTEEAKIFLKETIFVYQNQKVLKNTITEERIKYKKAKEQALQLSTDKLIFKKKIEKNLKIKFFESGATTLLTRRGYIQEVNNDLFFIPGTGKIYRGKLTLNKNEIVMHSIKSNFIDVVGLEYYLSEPSITNDILIDKNNIYISYTKKVKDNCYNNSIVVGKINENFINFKDFFVSSKCLADWFNYSSGGRLENIDAENLILSTGDFDPYSLNDPFTQQDEDLRGKVLKINKITKKYEVMSKGHRNPQGLFFEKLNNVVFSTDHGPLGGDEINIQELKNNKIYNFGWPIASYGNHYDPKEVSKIGIFKLSNKKASNLTSKQKYIKQPLLKSHKENFFDEPIKFWLKPNMPPTQILSIYDNIEENFHVYVVGLGNLGELHKSLHYLRLDKKFKILEEQSLQINQRIRDIIFIKKINSLLLYLEESSSFATIELKDNYRIK